MFGQFVRGVCDLTCKLDLDLKGKYTNGLKYLSLSLSFIYNCDKPVNWPTFTAESTLYLFEHVYILISFSVVVFIQFSLGPGNKTVLISGRIGKVHFVLLRVSYIQSVISKLF